MGDLQNNYTNLNNFGFNALVSSTGYRKDGSYFYSKYIFGTSSHPDEQFKSTLRRIKNATDLFQHNTEISKKRIKTFESIINKCIKNGIEVLVFMLPVAPQVYKKLNLKPQYIYIDKLRKYISTLPLESYDFHNPKKISMNECEYFDGFHGGDIVYEKILLKFSEDPKSNFQSYIKVQTIKDSIQRNKGKILSIYKPNLYKLKEIDFLQLGCKKLSYQKDSK